MTQHHTEKTIITYTVGLSFAAIGFALPLQAQVAGSALDHMLQRPKVAKHFADKRFGDHFFIEAGGGVTTSFNNLSPHPEKAAPMGGVGLGDWVTPLHGWRLGFRAGAYKYGDTKPSFVNLSADYLLNITALSIPTMVDSTYARPRRFEVVGVAGVDAYRASLDGDHKTTFGLHMGLRGVVGLSDFSYFYVEPRVGVTTDDVVMSGTWRRRRFTADVMAGLGYRVNSGSNGSSYKTDGHFLDDTFVSFAAGPSAIVNADEGGISDFFGATASAYVGKWFSATSGVRLGAHATTYKQPGSSRVKALGATVGYLWNMHNTFGGYNPDRRFWLNFVADAGINASASGEGKHWTPGFGGGFQANVRLARGVDFFIEPRVDLARDKFAMHATSSGKWDMMASAKGGLTFRQGLDTRRQVARNDDFTSETFYDHLFFEGGLGGGLTGQTATLGHPFSHLRPKVFVGAGKWFTATDGVRLWVEGTQYELPSGRRYKTAAGGVDYLWNINNALHGFNPDRRFELIGALGGNLSRRSGRRKLWPGLNAGIKGLWHATDLLAFYVEPQLRLYSKNYIPDFTTPGIRMDATASFVAGMQVALHGYAPAQYREAFAKADRKSFFSLAGGLYSPTRGIRHSENYGLTGRMSYGRWYTPISAWRLNLTGLTNPRKGNRYAGILLGGDYIFDGTALTYGYDEQRVVNLRGLLGLNLGMDYGQGREHFASDVHGGAQLAFRVGSAVELYAEPQMVYRLDKRFDTYMRRFRPTLYVGLNYMFKQREEGTKFDLPERRRFITAGMGTGVHSSTITTMSPRRRKLTLDYALGYGQWFTPVSGWRVGLQDATIQTRGKGNRHVTAFTADYLVDLLTLSGQAPGETGFRLNGFVGANLSIGSREGYRPTWSPGVQTGVQVGWAVTPAAEIYLEPSGTMNAKTLIRNSTHPAEAALRLMLGTKINF